MLIFNSYAIAVNVDKNASQRNILAISFYHGIFEKILEVPYRKTLLKFGNNTHNQDAGRAITYAYDSDGNRQSIFDHHLITIHLELTAQTTYEYVKTKLFEHSIILGG
jgi:hypothetical protein